MPPSHRDDNRPFGEEAMLEIRTPLTRRTMLASGAAIIAAPALADCPIGPPKHDKGPTVWMDMDQVEIDAAYDQDFYAPAAANIRKRYMTNSDALRARIGEPRREAYGPGEFEKLDIYRAKQSNAPIFVYIHGGAWVYKNAKSFDGDTGRFYIGGFSSGGHLCGVALVTDWQKDFGLPADMIRGGLCMSGMYDMKPVRISKRSSYVKFTDAMEQAMSTQRHLDKLRAPVVVTHGTDETPEFQRQNLEFVAAVKAAGKPTELVVAQHYNHFEMGEPIANPYGPNGRAALAMMKLA